MSTPMRVLVLGAAGMLGHQVVTQLAEEGLDVLAAARHPLPALPSVTSLQSGDITQQDELDRVFAAASADAVVNCVGLVKQRAAGNEPLAAIAANSQLPHRLALLCRQRGARLIHISTDCVFTGSPDGKRGPKGYRESDPAEAADIYGRSKLLGEVAGPGCLTLRMSLIGREHSAAPTGLVEWFLAASGPLKGYSGALFTGLTTPVAARLIALVLRAHPGLEGLWHAAAPSISKLDLLRAMAERTRPGLAIEPVAEPVIDRRLDGSLLADRIGWSTPAWPAMLDEMLNRSSQARAG